MPKHKYINTVWEMRTYDVWGNSSEGYEVNDSCSHGEHELRLRVESANEGTEHAFEHAYPSDRQIKQLFGVCCRIETDGDDLNVYVNRARDSYPIGELNCVSHDSLSPIRAKAESQNA